ncbi:type IV pilus twitching motility protein PilT [Calditerricola satsumensis]|uniref:Twitching motility protein PilT n=1 Tax=Calditerricola satsumensis TaxID=373054 RepID=A0A8J3FAJ6_9BACI|nr:type IV pilus twitching motility protein PilT [Calditerricola satsumensis]GGK01210.1 twitching motility protein PilT [Calditerricola satsumensis]
MRSIRDLLILAHRRGASDLHVSVGIPPVLRITGELCPLDEPPLKPEETESMAQELLNDEQARRFAERGELDFSYGIPGVSRFRVNVFRQRGCVAIAARTIPHGVPSLDELGLPPIARALAERPQGLFLVTGPTGSGKSTTLAAMVDYINTNFRRHIVTLEDPIEYLHAHKRSIVNQREVGQDTRTFLDGLRAALRQDPDVILIGEMRDLETIATALRAAETGHLVLATLHTVDAAQTVDRIIDVFPPAQQQQVRGQLANVLIGVFAQRLLPRADGRGRVAAVEVLVNTPAVANLIRQGKVHQIPSVMQTGGAMGMQTMEQAVRRLLEQRVINDEAARRVLGTHRVELPLE